MPDPDFTFEALGDHAIVRWRASPQASSMRAMGDELRARYAERDQRPMVCWMILDAGDVEIPRRHGGARHDSPSPGLRQMCQSVEVVLSGGGVRARLLRGAIKGMLKVRRGGELTIRVHGSVEAGVRALRPPAEVEQALREGR